jgi:hypothetical protein
VAEKFLTDPTKRIYSVVAQPEHMLGIFSKIGEYEYFLDYELILEPKEIWVFRTSSGSLEGVDGGHVAGGRPESS